MLSLNGMPAKKNEQLGVGESPCMPGSVSRLVYARQLQLWRKSTHKSHHHHHHHQRATVWGQEAIRLH